MSEGDGERSREVGEGTPEQSTKHAGNTKKGHSPNIYGDNLEGNKQQTDGMDEMRKQREIVRKEMLRVDTQDK